MTQPSPLQVIRRHLGRGGRLALFLNYDGMLVPPADAPAEAHPDHALLTLLADLARASAIQTVVLSGRSLATLESMLPVPGLILAGTYGVEIRQEAARIIRGAWIPQSRPLLTQIKTHWEQLVGARAGFLLEDRGCALALCARRAEPVEAEVVLRAARAFAGERIHASHLRLLGSDHFLEVVPDTANKRQAVHWFLSKRRLPASLPVYFGGDDGDDDAFDAIRLWGGISIGVSTNGSLPHAAVQVDSPHVVRLWLKEILFAVR